MHYAPPVSTVKVISQGDLFRQLATSPSKEALHSWNNTRVRQWCAGRGLSAPLRIYFKGPQNDTVSFNTLEDVFMSQLKIRPGSHCYGSQVVVVVVFIYFE